MTPDYIFTDVIVAKCERLVKEAAHLERQLAAVTAERDALREAVSRYLELDGSCDYVEGNPDVCPGIAEVGGPCHWCQLRAALERSAPE